MQQQFFDQTVEEGSSPDSYKYLVLVASNPPDESRRPIHNDSVDMDNMDWGSLDGALKKVNSSFLTTHEHLNLRSVVYILPFSCYGQPRWTKLRSWPSVVGQKKPHPMQIIYMRFM